MGNKCVPMCDFRKEIYLKIGCNQQLIALLFNNYNASIPAGSGSTNVINLYLAFNLSNLVNLDVYSSTFTIIGGPIVMW